MPATERTNQQKGVQMAAEIAARGLIRKEQRRGRTGAKRTPSGARRRAPPEGAGQTPPGAPHPANSLPR
jgi:hypothetical protein